MPIILRTNLKIDEDRLEYCTGGKRGCPKPVRACAICRKHRIVDWISSLENSGKVREILIHKYCYVIPFSNKM